MYRKLNLSLTCFFMALLVFTSCTKDNIQPQEKSNESLALDPTNNSEQYCFDNPANPYEYVGVEHNAALDALAASPNFGNMTIEEAHAIANQSINANLGVDYQVPYNEIVEAYGLLNSPNPLVEAGEALLADGLISPMAFDMIVQLNDLLDNSPDPNAYGLGVIELENQIMQNDAFTEDEKAILLGGTSIARHSACYWINAGMDTASPWYPMMGLGDPTLDKNAEMRGLWDKIKNTFKKVVKFIKKDIAGYKFAKKYVWILTPIGWKQIVISVVVGVIYSWFF